MASSLMTHQKFLFQFAYVLADLPKSPSSVKQCTPTFFSSSTQGASHLKLKPKHTISRASPEVSFCLMGFPELDNVLTELLNMRCSDLPTELIEDSKFVPLNSEDPKFGPPALLLLGFQVEEAAKIQQLLKEMDGEFLEVIFCTEDMINCSLWEAVNTKQPNLEASKVATSLPRICFLSGLTGEEMMMLIDAFPESGLEPPVFAALVPNSSDKPISELIEEIMGDHEILSARKTR